MNLKFKKIDAIIVVILIIVAGLFWYKIGYPPFSEEEKKPLDDQDEWQPYEKPKPPPISIIPDLLRVASSYDEGKHYDESLVYREWWYWSAVFHGRNNELKNWTVVISFNHMGRSDFRELFSEPDMLVVTLHGPNGEEYGGLINKERGYGILHQPTLKAIRPGLNVKFEDSWAEGRAPEWHVHVEDKDIDKEHEIVIDLDYFAPSEPLWIFGERAFEKSNSNCMLHVYWV